MTEKSRDEVLEDAAAWAMERMTYFARHNRTGRSGIRWVASLRVGELRFEHESFGDLHNRDALRSRAAEAVIQDFWQWVEDILDSGNRDLLPRFDA